MRRVLLASLATIGSVGLLHAAPALAHIDLLEPEARAHGTAAFGDTDLDENSNLKNAPCGQVTTARTERVARFAPGQTIRIRVREENAHESYLRVALDLDGNEFPLRAEFPGGAETQAEAEAAEAALGTEGLLLVYREENDTAGFVHELEVTLPEQSCDSCTLQVLQYMYDDPSAPYYFQCADLVIASDAAPDAGGVEADAGSGATSTAPVTGAGASGAGSMDSASDGTAGEAGAASPAAGATGAPATASGGRAGSASAAPVAGAAATDGGGCGIVSPLRRTSARGALATRGTFVTALVAVTLLGLVSRRSRRGRHRRPLDERR